MLMTQVTDHLQKGGKGNAVILFQQMHGDAVQVDAWDFTGNLFSRLPLAASHARSHSALLSSAPMRSIALLTCIDMVESNHHALSYRLCFKSGIVQRLRLVDRFETLPIRANAKDLS